MNMLKCCLNPKVLVGLAAVGVGLYLIAPGAVIGALPLLIGLVCPLSMLLMMRGMGNMGSTQPATPEAARGGQFLCPMHPDVCSQQPGRCTRCGMDLVPTTPRAPAPAPAESAAGSAQAPLGLTGGASREAQVGLLRAQLRVLDEQQAALAARITQLQESGMGAAEPREAVLVEAERVAQAAATRR